jgi:acetolactate synthase-1/2/3 large subunit
MYTTGTALLEAMLETGVEYIFANLGSDHSALVEALVEARKQGRKLPQLLTAPHEMVALSAAHGFAQLTGRAQAVVVHVECGTQSLGGAVHNAAKGRIPVLIFAGMSPATQEGEARGSRNEFIHYCQDVFDQRGIVRGYVKYDNDIRIGANVKQIVYRAMQMAHSEPKGPVYLVAAREVLESDIPKVTLDRRQWPPIALSGLPPQAPAQIAAALAAAKRPLVVSSYLGRNPRAVEELVKLARRVGIGVLESVPSYVNYPCNDSLHQGGQWNEKRQNVALAEADLILVLDSDVPWIPLINRPGDAARIIHIDTDPLKQQMPLWYIHASEVYRADAGLALEQINAELDAMKIEATAVKERLEHYERRHAAHFGELRKLEEPSGEKLTAEYLSACIRKAVGDDAIIVSEGVTNFHAIANHCGRTKPGTMFTSGAGSLGWNGGAALGMKLAKPDALVAVLTGDGSYMFSVPSTVHWMARRYKAPFLTVIYNNKGWRAPRFSAMGVHPEGHASRGEDIGVSFEPTPDYAGIAAAAGGAHAERVQKASEVAPALQRALNAVKKEGRCAVIDAHI